MAVAAGAAAAMAMTTAARYEGRVGGPKRCIYGDTLTILKPIFSIDSKKEPLTLDDFKIKMPSFKRREEKSSHDIN